MTLSDVEGDFSYLRPYTITYLGKYIINIRENSLQNEQEVIYVVTRSKDCSRL